MLEKKWYIVQVFSGFERKIEESLQKRIKLYNFSKFFGDIMIPTEEVIEIKRGQKRKSERKFFPGYILIRMNMNENTWHLVRGIPKVLGFVGGTSENPIPISKKEVDTIIKKLKQIKNKPIPKTLFEPGEVIRVNDGPFSDFNGTVEEVDYEKSRLKVSVSIFGRSTPVELDFSQVEKN
ncbi:transcription termination/antitermination protein NusG [bacterium endosymbiont of Pedicinus badii]|uniref:transcription termination/antitermination protein NusG n=1 Tax=bacterium endosymbiont of Pedicinus badii TaxID=1719126 RepID=UPI0009B9C85B|nr:transcription termination/antitermination protein NusG [bacterium endosymbiont of Pedicinus badii]OQM34045.1 transcription antiterminator NusG [bacterium endosymbiont of Pedicinus badii]